MDDRHDSRPPVDSPPPGADELIEDHEAEVAADEALDELKRESKTASEREYQKMASDLRWEVLEYIESHPDKPVIEIAEFFGIREGTVRAWKAHCTMGTYGKDKADKPASKVSKGARQRPLFEEKKPQEPPPFFERKRHSNFIHFFDKTPAGIVCPHFYILAHANGCPYACDYCYLRLTLRHYPEPTVFSNTARMFQELRDWLLSREEPSVLNAGELSDALSWDRDTRLTTNLIPLFAAQNKHKLLLLTKSTAVENLLKAEPTPQVIVSFSINAADVARSYERGAPPPAARLAAAKQLRERGWEVRLRLDPMIPIEGWRDTYEEAINLINQVEPTVVTLGSLRYFRTLINHAPSATDIFSYGKDHGDPDGRLRIGQDLRIEMYRFAMDRLQNLRVGLCKETEKVHEAMGLPGRHQSCNCTFE